MAKEISIQDYADLREISRQAVSYRIKNKLPLPGVIKIRKFGKVSLLTIKSSLQVSKRFGKEFSEKNKTRKITVGACFNGIISKSK